MDNSTASIMLTLPMNTGHRIVPSFNQIWMKGESGSRPALLDGVDKYEVLSK